MNFLVATKRFLPNDAIINLGDMPTTEDNPGRIQISNRKFILPPKDIYHSCNPNSHIDWDSMNLVADKEIQVGETVTYHYGTSEDDYSIGRFQCLCGYTDCVLQFRGFKYMNTCQRGKIKKWISPYLRSKYYK